MTCMPKSHLPRPATKSLLRISGFSSLDRRSGAIGPVLSEASGIDPARLPELVSAQAPASLGLTLLGTPVSLHSIGALLIAFTNYSGAPFCTIIRDGVPHTSMLNSPYTDVPRSVVRFNQYSDPNDPLSGVYRHYALVFPDALCIDLDATTPSISPLSDGSASLPSIQQACVHLSRIFGIDGDRLYASAFNDPTDWDLDTASDTGAANAWATTVQSNTRATGDFTALTVFDGHVHCFKEGFCHIVNNTRNPFRVADLLSVGAADARSLAEVDGKLFFADHRQVYCYNGSEVLPIGDPLAIDNMDGALAAAAAGLYYLYLPTAGRVFTYSPATGSWGALPPFGTGAVVSLCGDGQHCWFLMENGEIFSTEQSGSTAFSCTAAPFTPGEIRPYRLSRIALLLTAGEGASLSLSVRDSGGRLSPLLSFSADSDATRTVISKPFTPADPCFSLQFSGEGPLCIHRMELSVLQSEDD